MEIRFKTKEFVSNLKVMNSVVEAKNIIPILSSVHVNVFNDGNGGVCAVLQTSDSEMWLQRKVPLVDGVAGTKFCIDSAALFKSLSNLDDEELTISFDEHKNIATCIYGDGRFSMPYDDGESYPVSQVDMTNADSFVVEAQQLLYSVNKVMFAVADDPLRIILNGVHFDCHPEGMVSVATDTLKLAIYKAKNVAHDGERTYSFTIPEKPCNVLKTFLGNEENVKVSVTGSNVTFSNHNFKLTARLIEGNYPNCKHLVASGTEIAIVNKERIITALKRVMPMGNNESQFVQLSFTKDRIVIKTENIDYSTSATESVNCEYAGKDMVIGFKASYLIQVFTNIDTESATIEISDPTRPCLVYESEKDEYVSLIMPMLIR